MIADPAFSHRRLRIAEVSAFVRDALFVDWYT